ncbi:MAG TPA: glycerophosphoryl diester phosphodiesterase membrane domain-containing protein [Candidatus Binatia bacterium]|nr:glycerophosphoryl diester phosphodiesterase membrane domain-containing protein [Candidatus Binatia bacterium]
MPVLLRPLSLGELLDRAFQLYRSRFAVFAGIAAVAYIPLFVLRTALLWLPQTPSISQLLATGLGMVLAGICQMLALAAAAAATIIVVSAAYLDRPITLREAYGRVSGMLLRVFLIMFGSGIAIGIGLVLFIVPGVILFLMFALAIPVAVLEDAGFGESLSRSRELTAGHRFRVFAIYLLYFTLVLALDVGLLAPLGALVALTKGPAGLATVSPLVAVASIIVNYLVECLLTPVVTICLSLMYYDERVRKEAFDIQIMMNALGEGAPASVAGASSNASSLV